MKQKTSIKKTLMLLLLVTLLFSLVPAHSTAASPKLKKQSITLLTGQTFKNSVSNAKKVKWSTSNKKVATVNKNGTIKALQKGTATITATISKKKLKCKVKVESPTLSHENITVTKGYTAILTIKGTTQSTKWYSEDENIATILNGTITGVAIGNTRVYASNEELPRVLNGLGIALISTSKGIMTDKKAREQGIGGEVLAYVW